MKTEELDRLLAELSDDTLQSFLDRNGPVERGQEDSPAGQRVALGNSLLRRGWAAVLERLVAEVRVLRAENADLKEIVEALCPVGDAVGLPAWQAAMAHAGEEIDRLRNENAVWARLAAWLAVDPIRDLYLSSMTVKISSSNERSACAYIWHNATGLPLPRNAVYIGTAERDATIIECATAALDLWDRLYAHSPDLWERLHAVEVK